MSTRTEGLSKRGSDKTTQAKRYHGLRNQGSTCYLNSVLQVLFMTEDFREAVGRFSNHLEDPIDPQLDTLFENLNKRIGETYEITQKLGIDNVNEQRDAAEYLEKILNLASHEASEIFEIQLNNKTICGDCKKETDEEKSFWNLPLPLKQSSNERYSVKDAIKDFFKDSHFSEDNQLYCENCEGKRDATVKCVINQHPEVLMLLLKRFEFNYYQMCFVKNTRKVKVPFIVDITKNQTYELYAFVEHFGSLKSGHYTATIRSQDEDRWYKFNDSLVTELINNPVEEINKGTQSAYLLFYRKKGTDEDFRKVPSKRDLLPDINENSSSCQDPSKTEKDEDAKPNKDEASLPKRRKTSGNANEDGQTGLPTGESGEMVKRNRENSVQETERLNNEQHPPENAKPETEDSFAKNVNYKTNSHLESRSPTKINPVDKGVARADVQDRNTQVNDHSKMEEKPDLKPYQYDIKARQGQEYSSNELQENRRDKTPKQEPISVNKQDGNNIEADEHSQIVNKPAPLQEKPDKLEKKQVVDNENKGKMPKTGFLGRFNINKSKKEQIKENCPITEDSNEPNTENSKDKQSKGTKHRISLRGLTKKKSKNEQIKENCPIAEDSNVPNTKNSKDKNSKGIKHKIRLRGLTKRKSKNEQIKENCPFAEDSNEPNTKNSKDKQSKGTKHRMSLRGLTKKKLKDEQIKENCPIAEDSNEPNTENSKDKQSKGTKHRISLRGLTKKKSKDEQIKENCPIAEDSNEPIHPSIHFPTPLSLNGVGRCWCLSPASVPGERRGSPWTGRQSVADSNEPNTENSKDKNSKGTKQRISLRGLTKKKSKDEQIKEKTVQL